MIVDDHPWTERRALPFDAEARVFRARWPNSAPSAATPLREKEASPNLSHTRRATIVMPQ